jgi:metal-sulfur cluster biosynthetic enzyme
MITKDEIIEKLKGVIDPELGVNIVDLGLIYDVIVEQGTEGKEQRAKIVMTLTSPGCPLAGSFDFLVRQKLTEIPGLNTSDDVEIELTFDPPWTMEMMSEEVQMQLGFK